MSIEAAIVDRLDNFSALTSLISARLYVDEAPDDATYPYAVYTVTEEPQLYCTTGELNFHAAVFEFEVWATTYTSALAVIAQLKAALSHYSGTHATHRILGAYAQSKSSLTAPSREGANEELHGIGIDFRVVYEE